MPSFRRHAWSAFAARAAGAALVVVLAAGGPFVRRAAAQARPQGFLVERLYPAAPGAGWIVMDDLAMQGRLGGAIALTTGVASAPLRVSDGLAHLPVVSDEAFADFGVAATYDRWRLYGNFAAPLSIRGSGGTVGDYAFVAPSVGLGSHPDTVSDVRLGLDARLFGDTHGAFRLGAGAQLFVPSGAREDYDTDGTYRAMARVLIAGNLGPTSYAAQIGIHVRPRDDGAAPGGPRGSEALFGAAAGRRFDLGPDRPFVLVLGPEIFGQTAFRSFLATTATGIEGLVSARVDATGDDAPRLRVKVGGGGGLNPHFGAPEWRIVFGLELFGEAR